MSSFDRILQMVNRVNIPTFPLTASNVVLEDLVAVDAANYNTRVTLRARGGGQKYSGQVDLFLTRTNMTALGKLTLTQDHQFSLMEILAQINYLAKAQLGLEDITNVSVPFITPNTPTKLTLSARQTSFVWLGNMEVTLIVTTPTP